VAVKPVEYNHQSSSADLQSVTQGANKANLKDVTLTASNANEVKKDEDQGFTETLDKAQEAFLSDNVDTDTITYTEDEKKNTGKKAIDTKKTGDASTASGAVAGGGAVVGSAAVSVATIMALPALESAYSTAAEIPFVPAIVGALALAASIGVKSCVAAFDNQYNNRMEQNQKAADTNATVQKYTDTLNSNVEAMGQESSKYTELSGKTQDTNLSNVQQLAALQIQYNDLMAQGNIKGAADIKAQIDALKQGAAVDPNADAMKECKDNISSYQQNNAEASGVSESGSTVSEFLKDGATMGTWGNIIGSVMGVAAAIDAAAVAKSVASAAKTGFFFFAAEIVAMIGAALFAAAAVINGLAAKEMFAKAKDENSCGNSGDAMETKVNDLNSQITTQSGETGTVSTGYTTEDTTVTETTQKAQEAANKGVTASKATTEIKNQPKAPKKETKGEGAAA